MVPTEEFNDGTELRMEAIGTEEVIVAVLNLDGYKFWGRLALAQRAAAGLVKVVVGYGRSEVWYVAGAATSSGRILSEAGHASWVEPTKPWRSQFAEKRGSGMCFQICQACVCQDIIVEEILSRERIPGGSDGGRWMRW